MKVESQSTLSSNISSKGFEKYSWIKKCLAYESFYSFLNKKNINLSALNDAIRVISTSSLTFDFYHVKHIPSALRFGRKSVGKASGKVAGQFEVINRSLIVRFPKRYGRKESIKLKLTDDLNLNAQLLTEQLNKLSDFFTANSLVGNGHWPEEYDEEESNMHTTGSNLTGNTPLNQILYGPPGTGKTYHSIEAAVRAANPEFNCKNRDQLKTQYDELVKANRIRFVTFHQSYGYEEFVEGISADTDEELGIIYKKQKGIFKQICDDASNAAIEVNDEFNLSGKVWKLSIYGAHKNPAKTYCLENNIGAIGWSHTGDLRSDEMNDYHMGLGKNAKNTLEYFSSTAEVGDLVLCINSKTSIEAVGVITGDYQYNESGLPSTQDYKHQLPIHWLAKDINVDIKELNGNTSFNLTTFYPLWRLTPAKVLSHLAKQNIEIAEYKQKSANEVDNYVLIIDEINRGNISKIFGELITLIEPSKRIGNEEEIKLRLPITGDEFGVPNNVYIIGTMNTADRSLAMMDTALRRRFDFVEMMPNYKVLEGKVINYKEVSIDLSKLLQVMNKRIEVLYDREHTLGHAFLMPVVTLIENNEHELAFEELINVFKNKIVPLLEEYFFEDWNKIRLVLGDNTKADDSGLQFVSKIEQSYDEIFGSNHGLSSYEDKAVNFQIKAFDGEDSPWQNPRAYQQIYANSLSGNQ